MQIKLINVPLTDDGTQQAELNRFLAGRKVLEVEQKFFQNEKGGCWSFCIRYIESAASSQASQFTGKEKIDYKQVLNEQEFAIFSKLRECRKAIAAEDAVPAYAVFTDEELAGIALMNVCHPNFDVRKYFDSIDHDILKHLLSKRFKDKTLLNIFDKIIDSYNSSFSISNSLMENVVFQINAIRSIVESPVSFFDIVFDD